MRGASLLLATGECLYGYVTTTSYFRGYTPRALTSQISPPEEPTWWFGVTGEKAMKSREAFAAIVLACAALVVGCGTSQSTGGTATPTAVPSAAATVNGTATPNATATPKAATPTPTSTGPTLTAQQKQAVAQAQQYLSTEAFSQQGLIDQLDSSDGGEFTVAQATAAVDGLTTNWNNEAVQSAKQYLSTEAFSCNDLIAQLDSPDGGQFTVAQATYGAQQAGAC
jgi:hypothetical protein